MRNIFLVGAGKSSSWLIKYLLDHSGEQQWKLTVADLSVESALHKTGNHPNASAIVFDADNETQRAEQVAQADIVISLLPPHLHVAIAKECVRQKKNLVTASYVSKEMRELHVEALKNNVLLLNECGLDPGIDHMSAMKIIDGLKADGKVITAFKSYTGGLIAPESNDSPWGYKFSWNPRNVILAGQGTAKYIEDGKYRYIPYNRLFRQIEKTEIPGLGIFDGYANRDSLMYRSSYGISYVPTLLRGTLRQDGFCRAWDVFVQLGLTDDSYIVEDSEGMTYAQLVEAMLPQGLSGDLVSKVATFAGLESRSREMEMIVSTGILDDVPINLAKATPALILQYLLEQKWRLKEGDRDMIVMKHEFTVQSSKFKVQSDEKGHVFHQHEEIHSILVVKGEDAVYTAMAKTVGLPLAIAVKLILNNQIKSKGVLIPVTHEIYDPVLKELERFGIVFKELRK